METKKKTSLTPTIPSPERSFYDISSPLKTRNYNGIEKFLTSQQKKKTELEIELISNKIKMIMKLEAKAKKKIEIALKKSEEIQKIKARNEQKLKENEEIKEIKKKKQEEQRKKNIEEKEKRNQAIKTIQDTILKEKRDYAMIVKQQKADLDEMTKNFHETIRRQKSRIKSSRISEVLKNKVKSENFANKFMKNLKLAYEEKIAKEKEIYIEYLKKKEELEKQEAEVIQSYTKTISFEKRTLKNLEAVANVSLNQLGFRIDN